MNLFARLSLRGKILLSMSATMVILVLLTGWLVQRHVATTATQLVESEVRSSFQAYESLWNSRASLLASASRILSAMSDVRAAFSTGDEATIRDTAGELWSRISESSAIFLVADPTGHVIASLGGEPDFTIPPNLPVVSDASGRFPEQASGFLLQDGRSFQVVLTPVYVQSGRGPVLLNVLVAGFEVDDVVLSQLKAATGGSEFLFAAGGRILASTMSMEGSEALLGELDAGTAGELVSDGELEFAPLGRPLLDVRGNPVARLWILRSFQEAREQISELRRNILMILLAALLAGIVLTQFLARRIIGPVEDLDRAAAEIARENYDYRVMVSSDDELGRLARTFNEMCGSIQKARAELIRRERISTIGQMATSIIHDLRNPLAAIYGGSEMLVDSNLPSLTVKRLAGNIYRASRNIQTLLGDLRNVSRGEPSGIEGCGLRDVITAGLEPLRDTAERQSVRVEIDVPGGIEVSVERGRVERVFTNLIANALDAMPDGGEIRVGSRAEGDSLIVEVTDSGPGISETVRDQLFQPFTGKSKSNGMGLGLALSRQTMIDHGGDLWEESRTGAGARFLLRFPRAGADKSLDASRTTAV